VQREIISFEKIEVPIKIRPLAMRKGEHYLDTHFHSAIEIVEVKRGVLTCTVNNNMFDVKENQTVLINKNVAHKLFSEDAEIVYVQIEVGLDNYQDEFFRFFEFVSFSKSAPFLIFSENEELGAVIKKIYERYNAQDKHSTLYLKAYIYELIAFLHTQAFLGAETENIKEFEKIKPVVRYVDGNFKNAILLEDICNYTGYNKYSICHIFKAATDKTVFDYINFLRVQYAVQLLKLGNCSISDAAMQSGFSSANYFNRVFKSVMGCTPSQYKKHPKA
jgi:AraC-like DNA-binding protein